MYFTLIFVHYCGFPQGVMSQKLIWLHSRPCMLFLLNMNFDLQMHGGYGQSAEVN